MDNGMGEVAPPAQPVGVYGWRKRCLYSSLVLLTVVVIINLALTVWILRVLNFSVDGMGKLRIVPNGVRLEGQAEFIRPLYVQEIKADDGHVMYLESSKNIKLQAREGDGQQSGSLLLGDNKLQVASDVFEVHDSEGNMRLSVTEDEITVGVDDMKYLGQAHFEGSVQTPIIRGPEAETLEVKSNTSKVKIDGVGGVSLEATNGNIELMGADNIRIQSDGGSIFLESEDVYMMNLAVSVAQGGGQSYPNVHQLCMCTSGRVFLGPADGHCEASADICGTP